MPLCARSFRALVIIALLLNGACRVVRGGDEARTQTFSKLAEWKATAATMSDQPGYIAVRQKVNVWIEAKATEVTLAGSEYFSTVDVSPPTELSQAVDQF